MRYGTIGTSWITEAYIRGAQMTGKWELAAVYSRSEEKGRALAARTMEIFAQKGETPVYLHTQPWSWKAILLYMQLGFRLQRSDAFAAYENQTEQALRTLQAVLTPEQYAFVCAHCDD